MELLGNNDANYKLFFMHKQKKNIFCHPTEEKKTQEKREEENGRKNYENSECNLSWSEKKKIVIIVLMLPPKNNA